MRRTPLAVAAAALIASGCTSASGPAATTTPTAQPSASMTSPTPRPAATVSDVAAVPDWPTYHGSNDRAGNADVAALTPPLRVAWRKSLDAAMYAQPIVAAGLVVAATENNTLYAFDARTGRLRWHRHLVAPARLATLPCGNIDPSGITGTPAYDATTKQVFAVTESSTARHTMWALDIATGSVRWQRNVDAEANRSPEAEQERGALLVTGGRVVVAFGGRYGDCGNYVGYLVSVPTTGTGSAYAYAVPTARKAGMWAAAGPIVGPGGDLYVASGNGAELGGTYDGSDSVIRLSPTLKRVALFAPSVWPQDNADDLDLGAMSPVAVGGRIVIAGKRGIVYLLAPTLGGIGSQLTSIDGCAGYGGAAVAESTAYLPCLDGVRALRVTSSGRLHWLWGPVAGTLSPSLARGVVYALSRANGTLVELDATTGHEIGAVTVGAVSRFATPAPVGTMVYVGTTNALVAVAGRS